MSVPIWPASLPQRMDREPFQRQLASGRRLSRSDAGPPGSRLRYSQAARPISGGFLMTSAQLTRFWRFWDDEIGQGALPFWLPNQLVDGLPLITPGGTVLLTPAGAPILTRAWWLVLFDEQAPRESVPGGSLRRLDVSLLEMP
ncbi:hypothetical protein [Ancylobacter lacus]|uniref:hypothetical protein n=1 Tax=Ancylobacter lacus TaxID=2579970 RepID=UPI001BD1719D|nr:hypothetical protein [Ancylobacter lacus]MBS7538355.1 hypothetical protein [Ancylobacter lacus]